jgi:hypothetical protein
MINKTLLVTYLLAVGLGTACNARPIEGSGNVRSEHRAISDVHTVSLSWSGQMVIRQGEDESLTITADDNILPLITSDVRRGELVITIDSPYRSDMVRPSQPARFELTVRNVAALNVTGSAAVTAASWQTNDLALAVSGSGDIHIADLQAVFLDARLTGSGDITLAGQIDNQQVSVSGSGTFQAGQLRSQQASVSVTGSGTAIVWAEAALDATVSGSGSVDYRGQPALQQTITGSGSVRPLDE